MIKTGKEVFKTSLPSLPFLLELVSLLGKHFLILHTFYVGMLNRNSVLGNNLEDSMFPEAHHFQA